MQLSNAPSKIVEAFAKNAGAGYIRVIPVPSQIPFTPGAASYNDGFPPLTATPVVSGGVPPSIQDMNGILNEATAVDWWMSAGAGFPWDSTFSTAVGGYPKGSRVLMANGLGYWLSVVDNNTTNPDSGGAGWIPDRAAASVYANAQQTLASGNTKVLWNTVEYDTFGLWNAGSSRFTALWAGRYRFSGAVYLPTPGAQQLGMMIYKNGALARQCLQFPQTTDQALTFPFDAQVSCAVNDYLEAFMNVSATGVLAGQVGSNQAYVYGQIEFLGSN